MLKCDWVIDSFDSLDDRIRGSNMRKLSRYVVRMENARTTRDAGPLNIYNLIYGYSLN